MVLNSNKDYLMTKIGKISKHNKEDWIDIHRQYIEDKSLRQLGKELGTDSQTIQKYFDKFNLPSLSEEEKKLRRIQKLKSTCMERYGVTSVAHIKGVQDKIKKTNIEKYGCEFTFQADSVKEKIKDRILEIYGVDNPSKSDLIKEKKIATCRQNFNVDNALQSKKVREKIISTNLMKYGTKNVSESKAIIAKKQQTRFSKKHKDISNYLSDRGYELISDYSGVYNVDPSNKMTYKPYILKHIICGNEFIKKIWSEDFIKNIGCPHCFPQQSSKEILIQEQLKPLIDNVEFNVRNIIPPYELDVFSESLNIAVEYNGTYWHSTPFKDKNYHRNKTEMCLKKDIKLYHIWEHYDESIINSLVKTKLGKIENKFYARKLLLRKVDFSERKDFFNTNHLHGDVNSSFALGLYDNKELITCISFRKHKEGIEIARFATKLNSSCIGGFSKLLKHSIQHIKENYKDVNKIITYCDRDWTPDYKDSVYYKNGFTFVKDSGVQLRYYNIKTNKIDNREKYQKHKLEQMFPEIYSNELTADEILRKVFIYPIYNSGNWKFQFTIV